MGLVGRHRGLLGSSALSALAITLACGDEVADSGSSEGTSTSAESSSEATASTTQPTTDASSGSESGGVTTSDSGDASGSDETGSSCRASLDGTGHGAAGFTIDVPGEPVAGLGDVNGDGLDDVVAGSYVVFGKADTTAVSVADIAAGVGGFEVQVEVSYASRAGDVNGDGTPDVLLANPNADFNGANTGRVIVVFGKASPEPVTLAALDAGAGWYVDGEGGYFGRALGALGDLDGDGLDDVAIGAPTTQFGQLWNVGRVFVVRGQASAGPIPLADIESAIAGYAIDGTEADEFFGWMVRGVGDMNGDGTPDWALVAGARVYVVFGGPTPPPSLAEIVAGRGGFVVDGPVGSAAAPLDGGGDVGGDGIADLVIGSGAEAWVVFGKSSGDAVSFDDVAAGVGGFVVDGASETLPVAEAVAIAGDVNGDGLDDVLLSAHLADEEAGRAYVVFGRCTTEIVDLASVAAGDGGFAIDGEAGAEFGGRLDAAGDVDGDGIDDVVIATFSGGAARVVFGGVR